MSDAELLAIDPFDCLDVEAALIDVFLSSLPEADWSRPSRCAGWSTKDVLAHLLASEEYHHACLDGRVKAYLQEYAGRGATDIAGFNAMGIADLAGRPPAELLDAWREANADSRRRFRERGDGRVDTSVGDYPCRWQAFHVAGELATHADDMHLPVTPALLESRRAWRVPFSRFALAESKPDLEIEVDIGRTRVRGHGTEVEVDDGQLIEAVAGRLDESSGLDPAALALLGTMP